MALEQQIARLTYFNGRGRAGVIRFMLAETGTAYEERIITKELLAELRARGDLFFQQLPLLEMDGLRLVQTGAIVRYLARKHGLYGRDAVEAYWCDMIADGLADLRSTFLSFENFALQKADPAAYRDKVSSVLPRYLQPLEEMLSKNNEGEKKGFLLGERITYTDVLLLEILEHVREAVPSVLDSYPLLQTLRERMLERPGMKAFIGSCQRHPPINEEYIAHVKEVLQRQ